MKTCRGNKSMYNFHRWISNDPGIDKLEIASLIAAYHDVTSIMNFTNVRQIVSHYACKWGAVAGRISQ
jgi:hypothetical protein